jgi:hypothetical protein
VSLACPSCGREHPDSERFCAACGVPLVVERGAEAEVSQRQERARKVKRQYSEGELVRVAGGRNQPEAEFIQALLLEEGVPSTLKRTRGFDVPDMLAAGPRDVFVPASGAEAAHDILLQADLAPTTGDRVTPPGRLLAGLLAAVVLVAVIAWLGTELIG